MECKYSKIVARDMREAVVTIYGIIGSQINGDTLAAEINYLSKEADVIVLRINSLGGNLIQSLSVIGAILGSKSQTVAVIEGIAASSAALIALSCKRVKMNDYGRLMLHAPYYVDDEGKERKDLTGDEQTSLTHTRGMLSELLSRRGKKKEEVDVILDKDTWYTASEATKQGFVDEIIDTGIANQAAGLSLEKLVAFVNEKNLPTDKKMKKVFALLKIGDDANEAEVCQAIMNLNTKVTTLEGEKSALETEIGNLKNASQNEQQAKVKEILDEAITGRKILASQRPEYETLFGKDFASTKKILDAMPPLPKIETGGTGDKAKKFAGKNWDDLDKAGQLDELKVVDEAKFKELYKEKFGKEYRG